jgi:hypothetical protein
MWYKKESTMQDTLITSSKAKTKQGTRLVKATSLILLGLGATSLITSIIYVSQVLAFIGLSLVFWGALLLYIQPEEYTRKAILEAVTLTSLTTLNQIMQELDYKGNAIYLPPKYLKDPEENKIYISKYKDAKLPTPELSLKQESQLFIKNPQGILLTPPGAEMVKLFEKTLGTSFTKVDMQYLQIKMPKLLIEDLEIAEDIEMQTKEDTIYVKITDSIYKDMWKRERDLSYIHSKIGCPICSAIACAMAKATGKPVIIENTQLSKDGKTLEGTYRILELAESQEQIGESTKTQFAIAHYSRLSKLAGISLIGLGSIILSVVGWITYYDTTIWGKSLGLIFLGSRTGEAIDLGIGMRVLYYFVLGLASTLMGILVLFRRLRKRIQTISGNEPAED